MDRRRRARRDRASRAADAAALTPADVLLVARMRGLGMRMPVRTLAAARKAKLPVSIACAVLMQETGGGINEFGHDPTVAVGWGTVTEGKYEAYKVLRDVHGHGSRCQGVGPVQLTGVGFQDRADAAGGCWRPAVNMYIGFYDLAHAIRRDGLRAGVKGYNGSGPAADRYADLVIARANGYADRLHLPRPT